MKMRTIGLLFIGIVALAGAYLAWTNFVADSTGRYLMTSVFGFAGLCFVAGAWIIGTGREYTAFSLPTPVTIFTFILADKRAIAVITIITLAVGHQALLVAATTENPFIGVPALAIVVACVTPFIAIVINAFYCLGKKSYEQGALG